MFSRLLTARREVQTLGGKEGSAKRSVMSPWASPITAISTVILVPEDWNKRHRENIFTSQTSVTLMMYSLSCTYKKSIMEAPIFMLRTNLNSE